MENKFFEIHTLLIDENEYKRIWDKIDSEFKFTPNGLDKKHTFDNPVPFRMSIPHVVYSIEELEDETEEYNMNHILLKSFTELQEKGYTIYALDWNHDCYVFDRKAYNADGEAKMELGYTHPDGYECNLSYPSFYPNGDYHFFVEKNLQFGILGHPWRQEMWVFGDEIIPTIELNAGKMLWQEILRA